MRIRKPTLRFKPSSVASGPFWLGVVLMLPLNIFVLGTPIFVVQQAVMGVLLVYMLIGRRKIQRAHHPVGRLLDQLFLVYIGWNLLSFLASALINFDTGQQLRRLFSLFMFLSMAGSYVVGRDLIRSRTEAIPKIMAGLTLTGLATCLYFVIFVYATTSDMFIAREAIGQRLPFGIAFIATIAGVLALYDRQRRPGLIVTFVIGAVVVILSLTRAAYIQLAVSMVALTALAFNRYVFGGRDVGKRLLKLAGITALLLVGLQISPIGRAIADFEGLRTINERLQLLMDVEAQSSADESGSERLSIWIDIARRMSDEPLRWIVGYGQLGASLIRNDNTGGTVNNAHSEYMDHIVREGLVGLLLFLSFYLSLVLLGVKQSMFSHRLRPYILANSIALAGVIFYGFFHETIRYALFGFYFWFYAGLAAGTLHSMAQEELSAPESPRELGPVLG